MRDLRASVIRFHSSGLAVHTISVHRPGISAT
jgi:hypothetical protein